MTASGLLKYTRGSTGCILFLSPSLGQLAVLITIAMFAVMFAGQCLPTWSDAVGECQCRSTKRGARTGPLVFSVGCSTNRATWPSRHNYTTGNNFYWRPCATNE